MAVLLGLESGVGFAASTIAPGDWSCLRDLAGLVWIAINSRNPIIYI